MEHSPVKTIKFFYRFLFLISFLSSCNQTDSTNVTKGIPVTTMIVEAKDVPVSFEYIAQTQSSHSVNIQARVNGFLDQRVYIEGEMVKAGDILFLMDKKPFQTQVDAAKAAVARQEAAFATAKSNLARVKPLAEQNALSQKDLDDAIGAYETSAASVEQDKAQLETALLNLSYCTIISPIDGITSSALKQDGTYINIMDSKLTTVAALSPIWVNFSLSENEIQRYRDEIEKGVLVAPPNKEFEVKVIQVNGKIFPYSGKITFTEPFFNPQTGTFLIRASLENPDGVLRPNQYVRAKVEGAIRPKAILIPQRAVQQSSKGPYVWVVDQEHKAVMRPVEVGDWQGTNWFINDGLLSGEQVVIDGTNTLHSGAEVEISTAHEEG